MPKQAVFVSLTEKNAVGPNILLYSVHVIVSRARTTKCHRIFMLTQSKEYIEKIIIRFSVKDICLDICFCEFLIVPCRLGSRIRDMEAKSYN